MISQKKVLIVMVFVLTVAIGALVQQHFDSNLQSQVLQNESSEVNLMQPDTEDGCLRLSENVANACLLRIAIENQDDTICRKITKASERRRCEREVAFAQ